MKKIWIALLLIGLPFLAYSAVPRWIDLTHDFSSETIYWPTAKSFQLETVYEGMTPQNFYYSAKQFAAAEHGGTHIDAPSHFAQGKQSVDQIPIPNLMGKAVIIDVRKNAIPDDDYLISIGDIKAWEKDYGPIPKRSIVLFYTGYGKYWPKKLAYLGTTLNGEEAIHTLHFPGLAKDTAEWLIDNRNIKAVGIDTASIDYGQTIRFPTHQVLAKHNIPIFENVANLENLHSPFAEIVALPMKIKGGTGAPLRIIAKALPYKAIAPTVEKQGNKNNV